jgi:hypothetical protein
VKKNVRARNDAARISQRRESERGWVFLGEAPEDEHPARLHMTYSFLQQFWRRDFGGVLLIALA